MTKNELRKLFSNLRSRNLHKFKKELKEAGFILQPETDAHFHAYKLYHNKIIELIFGSYDCGDVCNEKINRLIVIINRPKYCRVYNGKTFISNKEYNEKIYIYRAWRDWVLAGCPPTIALNFERSFYPCNPPQLDIPIFTFGEWKGLDITFGKL